jgi:WD40 repeat protein
MKRLSTVFICLFYAFFLSGVNGQTGTSSYPPNYQSEIYCFSVVGETQTMYYVAGDKLIGYNYLINKVIQEIDISIDSPVIAIQKKDDVVFLGTKSGEVHSLSLSQKGPIGVIDLKAGSVTALAMTSDGKYLLTGCENGMVYSHYIDDISNYVEFFEHDSSITSIAVSEALNSIAVSSGDGTISLFKEPNMEWKKTLKVGKKWVRQVAFNSAKKRLLCVGDDGRLREWNIAQEDNFRLLNEARVSNNWLYSVTVNHDGEMICWGGLDHVLKARFKFGSFEKKLKGPIVQAAFLDVGSSQTVIACCVLGKGIQIVPAKEMKFKSNY